MANEQIFCEALIRLMQAGEIDVYGQKGGSKRFDSINSDDSIKPGQSPVLIPVPRPSKKRSN